MQGNFQLIQWGWSADYPDPENFLFLLYGPNAKVTSQGENAANYDNPRFNELFRRAENMVNSTERAALIRDMLAIAQEDAPWIWGFHPVGYGLYHAWQHNTKPLTFGGNTLKYKRIDPDLREQSRVAWNRPITAPLWVGSDGTHFSHDSGDHQHLQTPTPGATAMMTYIIRRCLYAIPVLFGVNILVFLLFFFVNSPDHMARAHLGQKRVTPEQIDAWKRERLLHLPYFYNAGWRRIGSLPAAESDNTAEFPTAGGGEYALVIEAPETPRALPSRTVRLQSSPPERLMLPADFDAQGTVNLSPKTPTRRFLLRLTSGASPEPPVLRITFTLAAPAPTQRVLLEYKEPLPLLSRLTQTIFFQRSVKMLAFQYGTSDDGKDIGAEIMKRIGPSLSITVPAFVLGLFLEIFLPWGLPCTGARTSITGRSSSACS